MLEIYGRVLHFAFHAAMSLEIFWKIPWTTHPKSTAPTTTPRPSQPPPAPATSPQLTRSTQDTSGSNRRRQLGNTPFLCGSPRSAAKCQRNRPTPPSWRSIRTKCTTTDFEPFQFSQNLIWALNTNWHALRRIGTSFGGLKGGKINLYWV